MAQLPHSARQMTESTHRTGVLFLAAMRLRKTAAPVWIVIGELAALQSGCKSQPAGTSGGLPSVQVSAANAADPRFAAVLSYLQQQMSTNDIPGAAIGIVQDGALAFQAGVGVKQLGEPETVQPTTLFRVASLSKMVLAATTMKLVEQGKLDLTRPVTDYVPFTVAAPFDASTISLRALLTHTAGVPDMDGTGTLQCPVGPGQEAAWFSANPPVPLWAPPGQIFDYSNMGYALMGWVIESVTGEVYDQAAADLILGPTGMTTATFDPAAAEMADHAVGLDNGSGVVPTLVEPTAIDCAVQRPPSGLIASIGDYAQFAEMIMSSGSSVLQPSSVVAMETEWAQTDDYPGNIEQYGYGLYLRELDLNIVWHEGNLPGYQSSIYMVPAQNWAVIVFLNASSGNPNDISQFAVNTFLRSSSTQGPVFTTPPSSWNRYEGTYVDPSGTYLQPDAGLGTITVSLQGSELIADWNGQTSPDGSAMLTGLFASTPLTQIAGDRFEGNFGSNGGTQDVTFFPGEDGGAAAWFVTRVGVGARQ